MPATASIGVMRLRGDFDVPRHERLTNSQENQQERRALQALRLPRRHRYHSLAMALSRREVWQVSGTDDLEIQINFETKDFTN